MCVCPLGWLSWSGHGCIGWGFTPRQCHKNLCESIPDPRQTQKWNVLLYLTILHIFISSAWPQFLTKLPCLGVCRHNRLHSKIDPKKNFAFWNGHATTQTNTLIIIHGYIRNSIFKKTNKNGTLRKNVRITTSFKKWGMKVQYQILYYFI